MFSGLPLLVFGVFLWALVKFARRKSTKKRVIASALPSAPKFKKLASITHGNRNEFENAALRELFEASSDLKVSGFTAAVTSVVVPRDVLRVSTNGTHSVIALSIDSRQIVVYELLKRDHYLMTYFAGSSSENLGATYDQLNKRLIQLWRSSNSNARGKRSVS
jgi:hypothetical protein